MSDGNPFVAEFNEHADWGVGYTRTFQYLDDAGDPIDIDAYTATLSVRQDYSTDVLLTLSGVTDADGEAHFTATGSEMEFEPTAQYAQFTGVYDVILTLAGNPTVKLVRGSFSVHPTVVAV